MRCMGVNQLELRPLIPLHELQLSPSGVCVYTHQRRARVPNGITQPLEATSEFGVLFSVALGPHPETQ